VAQRYCTNCGAELGEENRFCPNCGGPVHQSASVPTPEADIPVPPPPQDGEQHRPRISLGKFVVGFLALIVVLWLLIPTGDGSGGGGNGGGGKKEVAAKSKQEHKQPQLDVSSPSGSPTVTRDSIEVKGKVTPANSKVTVNGQEVTTDEDGLFSTPYHRNVGEIYIQITAVNGSEQADASQIVTRKLSEKELAAQEAAQEQAKKEEEKPQAKPKPKSKPKPQYRVGQTANVANVTWKVSDAFLTNQLNSSFGTHKRGRFVVIDFTFTNNRNEEVTLDPELHMILKDSQGREFGTDVDAYEFMPTDLNIFLEPVNPGVSKTGRVIYQVGADATGFTLTLDDVEFWEDKSAVFDLGVLPARAYVDPSAGATASPGP